MNLLRMEKSLRFQMLSGSRFTLFLHFYNYQKMIKYKEELLYEHTQTGKSRTDREGCQNPR